MNKLPKIFLLMVLVVGTLFGCSKEEGNGYWKGSGTGKVDTNIMKLKASNSCMGCNLQGADLNAANLSVANLSGADLSGAIFCRTKTPAGMDDSGC